MAELTVGEAAAQTGWSPRMLRYLEGAGLVVPRRSGAGYRLYGLLELNQLRSLRELRRRHDVELTDVASQLGSTASRSCGPRCIPGWQAQNCPPSTGNNASTSGSWPPKRED